MQAFLVQQIAAAALRYAPAVVNDDNYNEFVSYLEAISVPDETVFGGIATPRTSPPRISLPTIYLAVMGGTYKAFSSLGVDEGLARAEAPRRSRRHPRGADRQLRSLHP